MNIYKFVFTTRGMTPYSRKAMIIADSLEKAFEIVENLYRKYGIGILVHVKTIICIKTLEL